MSQRLHSSFKQIIARFCLLSHENSYVLLEVTGIFYIEQIKIDTIDK
jgi:hypothetical protein